MYTNMAAPVETTSNIKVEKDGADGRSEKPSEEARTKPSASAPPQPPDLSSYAESLRQWLAQYYAWQQFNAHAAYSAYAYQWQYYASHAQPQQMPPSDGAAASPDSTTTTAASDPTQPAAGGPRVGTRPGRAADGLRHRVVHHQDAARRPDANGQRNIGVEQLDATVVSVGRGHVYRIPKLWKRFLAEVIDFFILFAIKVFVTFIATDYFNLIDLSKYEYEVFVENTVDLSTYENALEFTSSIMILELLHRIVVSIFELLCLRRGGLSPGGSTPGKHLVGIKVVFCERVHDMPATGREEPGDPPRVLVVPASDLGLGWASVRAVAKNLALAFVFPACFTMCFSRHGRATYDVLANSVVVEDVPDNNRRVVVQ